MNLKQKNHEILIMVMLIVVVGAVIFNFTFSPKKTTGNIIASGKPVLVTPNNLPSYLSGYPIINDLPKKASIYVKFDDLSYSVTRGSVIPGVPQNPDVVIILPEEYIGKLGYGVCGALREAIRNGDLRVESDLSNAQLLWKFKRMLKYRDCIGG